VTHTQNGLLVCPDDEDDLASAIVQLATDGALRMRLGREARRTVKQRYSIDYVAEQHIQLYRRLLASAPAVAAKQSVVSG
jgi:glycosyltransferase involved in cell wall biosynthesis